MGAGLAISPITVQRLDADLDLLALHAAWPERYPYLLESVAHGTPSARYDILFAFPGKTLVAENTGHFLQHLEDSWQAEHLHAGTKLSVPFHGGWFVYLGYELAQEIEPCLSLPAAPASLPVAMATRIPAAIVRDHEQGCLYLVAEDEHAAVLEIMAHDVRHVPRLALHDVVLRELSEDPPERYMAGVERIKRYIHDGDVFQVNLSRAWHAEMALSTSYLDIYQHLRRSNPAPFAGLARYRDSVILSSSPERLVQVRDGMIQTRPIAGTRPRGTMGSEDHTYASTLMTHPKERAEHIMLIDLERNDLGRVCRPGSVVVDELMVLESYAHVHHIVSNIRGQLRPEVTPVQVIRAMFPGGTITGCPKVRCMEIIAELEQTPRAAYTGSMGYINRDGSLDLNILIRTVMVEGRRVHLRAGAGIVADSQATQELAETRAKARGMLLALGATG